jgi:hypothetical protein
MSFNMNVDSAPEKVRVVSSDTTPPAWALGLITQVNQLQEKFNQLLVSGNSPCAPPIPTPPPTVTAEAISAMMTDPRIPDVMLPLLKVMGLALAKNDDELTPAIQEAYNTISTWVSDQPNPAIPAFATSPRPSLASRTRSRSPAATRFTTVNGVPYYRSAGGRLWDIRQPPPYACRKCKLFHWSWSPCPTSQTPHATSSSPNDQGGCHSTRTPF